MLLISVKSRITTHFNELNCDTAKCIKMIHLIISIDVCVCVCVCVHIGVYQSKWWHVLYTGFHYAHITQWQRKHCQPLSIFKKALKTIAYWIEDSWESTSILILNSLQSNTSSTPPPPPPPKKKSNGLWTKWHLSSPNKWGWKVRS